MCCFKNEIVAFSGSIQTSLLILLIAAFLLEREGVGEGTLSTQACTNEWLGLVDGKDLLIWGYIDRGE